VAVQVAVWLAVLLAAVRMRFGPAATPPPGRADEADAAEADDRGDGDAARAGSPADDDAAREGEPVPAGAGAPA
jgi:hypothetical protein